MGVRNDPAFSGPSHPRRETEPSSMLQLLLDTIPTGVFWKDRNSIYLGCNRLFAANTGLSSPEEVLGKSDDDMPWRDKADECRADDRTVVSTGVPRLGYEERHTTPDGRIVIQRKSKVPLRDREGLIIGVMGISEDVTECRKAEEALRRSEEKYRELVQNANSIVLRWGRDGTISFFNEFAQSLFGYTEDEIVGRNVMGTIVPETETSGRDLQAMIDDITAHPERHETNVNENMRKSGERVWIAWTNRPVLDEHGNATEILSVGLDITQRIRDQRALQESMELFTNVVRNMQVGLYIYDLEDPNDDRTLRLVAANPASTTDLGLSESDAVGKYIDEVFPGLRERGIPQRFAEVALTGIPFSVTDFPYSDARLAPRHFSFRVFCIPGNQVGVLFEDTTDLAQAEEDMQRFYRNTIEAATDGKLIICDREQIDKITGPLIAMCDVSNARDVGTARRVAAEAAERQGMDEAKMFDLALCVGEAATNALKHASRGTVSVHKRGDALLVLVTDYGPGIPAINLPYVALKKRYTTAASLGMGYKAMISIADQVYLTTGPQGTAVGIEMKLRSTSQSFVEMILPDTW